MAEKWAQKCAKLEKGASGFIFEATQEYAQRKAADWSPAAIAKEVTEAGFAISTTQIQRRLKALAQVEGQPVAEQEAAFANAYTEINRADQGTFTAPVKTEEDAQAVVKSLSKAPAAVQDTVYQGLKEVRMGIGPAERKAAEARVSEYLEPVEKAVKGIDAATRGTGSAEVIQEILDDVEAGILSTTEEKKVLRTALKLVAVLEAKLGVSAR